MRWTVLLSDLAGMLTSDATVCEMLPGCLLCKVTWYSPIRCMQTGQCTMRSGVNTSMFIKHYAYSADKGCLQCLAVFFPAAYMCANVFCKGYSQQYKRLLLAALLLQPALLLIDHGHFQYNCISLGMTAAAAAAIVANKHIVGSILYCLALNHKQMSLFYAPAFFGHLLGCCLQKKTWPGKVRV